MRKTARLLSIVLVALLAVTAGQAAREIQRTIEATPDGTVSVEIIAGSLEFVGWGQPTVEITGSLGDDVEEVEIESDSDGVQIEVDLVDNDGYRGRRNLDGAAHLVIHVPFGSHIDAETVSASVSVEGIDGTIEIESVSGEVDVNSSSREIEISTVSGVIRVTGDTELESGDFETVSGRVEFDAPVSPRGRFSFEAVSGDVILRLPSGVSAEFNVETFNGDIENELGPAARKTSPYLPSKSLEFRTGGGGARFSIESFSGNVKILHR